MKIESRVDRALNTLVKALINNTLVPGICTYCAVGNLVAKGMNIDLTKYIDYNSISKDRDNGMWSNVFMTNNGKQYFYKRYEVRPGSYELGLKNIEATEFTLEELAEIELTFETNVDGFYKRTPKEDLIEGIIAVAQVMLYFSKDYTTDPKRLVIDKIKKYENIS